MQVWSCARPPNDPCGCLTPAMGVGWGEQVLRSLDKVVMWAPHLMTIMTCDCNRQAALQS